MKKQITFIHIILSITVYCCAAFGVETPYQALVVVPVADLVGEPRLAGQEATHYNLPVAAVGSGGCHRIHQMIFNEIVTVVEEHNNEIKVQISNLFFEPKDSTKRFFTFWTHKHAVVPLATLQANNVALNQLPESVNFNGQTSNKQQQVVTLTAPHYDPLTRHTYSAGTRFVQAQAQHSGTYAAYAYSTRHHKLCTITLPAQRCLVDVPTTHADKIKLFVKLVEQWANTNRGFIPYVHGGCSFTGLCNTPTFVCKNKCYYRPTFASNPTPGMDCSGLISRIAQMCGIPYYFKNTTTMARYLRTIKPEEPIENGDIIWVYGHVIVITDNKKNMCVEARSYDHGFGKIHTIAVNKLFENMNTLEDIKTAMLEKKPVVRLNHEGNTVQTMDAIKIFKLASVWRC